MNVNDMHARVRRLEDLARGLGVEVRRWKADPGPLAKLGRAGAGFCQCWRWRSLSYWSAGC
jgi:hypothetical protein